MPDPSRPWLRPVVPAALGAGPCEKGPLTETPLMMASRVGRFHVVEVPPLSILDLPRGRVELVEWLLFDPDIMLPP